MSEFSKDLIKYSENLNQRMRFEAYAEAVWKFRKFPFDGSYGMILLASGNCCLVRQGAQNSPLYSLIQDSEGVITEYREYPTTEIPFVWPAGMSMDDAVESTNTTEHSLQILGHICFKDTDV